ncbi:hypothetical protein PO909_030111 [Leuciscus waleckii]
MRDHISPISSLHPCPTHLMLMFREQCVCASLPEWRSMIRSTRVMCGHHHCTPDLSAV